MEYSKVCFRCGILKPISEYYKHPKMGDGHLNKCKDCTKSDSAKVEAKIRSTPEGLEAERKRHRDKYYRLGYKNKANNWKYCTLSNCRRKIKTIYNLEKGQEIHHWNYNLKYSVFIIDIKLHKKAHKLFSYDVDSKCYLFDNILLDTKEKHKNIILKIASKYNLSNEIIDIETTIK